jgi:hypothetical protein
MPVSRSFPRNTVTGWPSSPQRKRYLATNASGSTTVAASNRNSRGKKSTSSRSRGRGQPLRSGTVTIFLSSGGGASRQEPVVFTPMPKMARPPGVVSTRMPASFRPLASMSLGHRTSGSIAGTHAANDSANATPQASDHTAGGAASDAFAASTTTLTARLP